MNAPDPSSLRWRKSHTLIALPILGTLLAVTLYMYHEKLPFQRSVGQGNPTPLAQVASVENGSSPTEQAADTDATAAIASLKASPTPASPTITGPSRVLPEYKLDEEDAKLCHDFYTEAWLETILKNQESLCPADSDSELISFDVPTHPHHNILRGASPVHFARGVTWDSGARRFKTHCPSGALSKQSGLGYDASAAFIPVEVSEENPTCKNSSGEERPLVLAAFYEEDNNNIWHRLQDFWTAQLSLDVLRMAIDEKTRKALVTDNQLRDMTIVFPHDALGPWKDFWPMMGGKGGIVKPGDFQPDPSTCFDVVLPTCGWGSVFWSQLLKMTYETCRRETLMTNLLNRMFAHTGIQERKPEQLAQRGPNWNITIVQRERNRKFTVLDGVVEKLKKNFPQAKVEVVDLAQLHIVEQIRLSQDTDVLVGHHGAAMTHVIFQTPGAATVEVVPPYFNMRGFRWVALMRGLNHFVKRSMWPEEYEHEVHGVPYPKDWKPSNDNGDWQTREFVYIKEDDMVEVISAAVQSLRDLRNDDDNFQNFRMPSRLRG